MKRAAVRAAVALALAVLLAALIHAPLLDRIIRPCAHYQHLFADCNQHHERR